jgi:hypothetical protein
VGGARALALTCAAGILALAGCGSSRQDKNEPKGTFAMKVVHASFPTKQAVARPATLTLTVKNTGEHTVPDVAITVDSFAYASKAPELAANARPVWAIEHGPGATAKPPVQSVDVSTPGSAQTAYVNTWALGPLKAGATQSFSWHVVAVKPGAYTVHYTVAAGTSGKAKARAAGGNPLQGQFSVVIAGEPPITHVNPATGKLAPGAFTSTP